MNEGVYPPEKLAKYPHMLPHDIAVWERFIDKHGANYLSFKYDVHVGGDVVRENKWTEEEYKMAYTLSAKRIDVVAETDTEIWIIEVKPEAGVTALGQLVGYRDLYVRDFKPAKIVVCALVCANIAPDERWMIEKQGFVIFVV